MRLKLFNKPKLSGAIDLPSVLAGLITIICTVMNIPIPG